MNVKSRFAAIVALCATLLVSPLAAGRRQNTQQQSQPQTPPKSTAFILGQVVDGSTGQPIAEAVVTLRPMGGRGANARRGGAGSDLVAVGVGGGAASAADVRAMLAGRGGQNDQRLMTGGDGRFIFHSLPPGQYSMTVQLTGYSSSLTGSLGMAAAMMGAPMTTANENPSVVALTEGQRLSDLKLRLWKHASVSGTVLDDGGEPAIGLTVQAMRRIMVAGRARYAPAASGKTDDRGFFRIGSMLPADYIIVIPQAPTALPAGLMEGMAKGMMSMASGGAASGNFDVMGMAELMSSGVNIGAAAQGVRIDDYLVASASGALPIVDGTGRVSAYQTAFYAGVYVPAQASVVTLKSGDDRTGVDFQLRLTPTFRVKGIATGPAGPVANLGVRLVVPADGITSDSEFDVATTITGADGRFSFFGVPPGQFVIRAQKEARPEAANALAAMGGMFAGANSGPKKSLFGQASVSVSSTDIENLAFELVEGFTVSGRVEFQPSKTSRSVPPTQNAGVMLMPADGRTPSIFALQRQNRISENRTFEVGNQAPGRYFLNQQGMPAPWQLVSATVGGRDVYDTALEIKGDVTDVVLTFSDEQLTLSGTVTATAGQKPEDAIVYLFPADYRAWIADGMNPRRSKTARAQGGGSYAFGLVPRGDYMAAAIDRSDEGDLQDATFVEALAKVAVRVSVTSEKQTLDLTAARVRR